MSTANEKAVFHYNLGIQYEKEGNPKEAVAEYRRALEADNSFPYPYRALGEIHYRDGALDEALKDLSTALRLDPNWVEVMALLAEVYYDKGDLARALHFQEKAVQNEPNNIHFNTMMGKMLITDKRYSEAIDVLNNILKHDEENFLIHYNLGVAYGKRALQDLDESIEHWKAARNRNPDDPQVHRNLGITYFTKGMLPEAMECFRKTLAIDRDDAAAKKFLQYAESLSKK